jgi:4-amino-4-deoxychorismate lyase
MTSLVYIDGQASAVLAVTDRATQYGDGLFETMHWRAGQLLRLDKHLNRLQRGCRVLSIPFDQVQITRQLDIFLAALAHSTSQQELVVKLIISRGSGGRGYTPSADPVTRTIISSHPMPARLGEFREQGIDSILCAHRLSNNPLLAGIKHLNRLDQVLGSAELQRVSGQLSALSEGLMLDQQGHVVEGTRSNLFLIRNDELLTPELDQAGVAGIMRHYVLGIAGDRQWPVIINRILPQDLASVDSAFICNSILGVLPLRRLWLTNDCSGDRPPLTFQGHNYIRELQSLLA